MQNTKQKILEEFDKSFPRFGCDDDYCAPTVRTIGENKKCGNKWEE